MSRFYYATFQEQGVSELQDLFELNAPAAGIVVLHEVVLTQSSDAGDSESEQLNVLIHRGSTSGSGGSAVTPVKKESGDAAAASTVEVNNTSQSTEGDVIRQESFNVMAGLQTMWTPEMRPIISNSGRIVISLKTVPADLLTMSGTITFEEIG